MQTRNDVAIFSDPTFATLLTLAAVVHSVVVVVLILVVTLCCHVGSHCVHVCQATLTWSGAFAGMGRGTVTCGWFGTVTRGSKKGGEGWGAAFTSPVFLQGRVDRYQSAAVNDGCAPFFLPLFPSSHPMPHRYFHGWRPWLRKKQGSRDRSEGAHHWGPRLAIRSNMIKGCRETYREALILSAMSQIDRQDLHKRKIVSSEWYDTSLGLKFGHYLVCGLLSLMPFCYGIMVLVVRCSSGNIGGWWWWGGIGKKSVEDKHYIRLNIEHWTSINNVTCIGVWMNLGKNRFHSSSCAILHTTCQSQG